MWVHRYTDPSEARVQVPDDRFDWLCDVYRPKKLTPAYASRLLLVAWTLTPE